MKFYISLLVVLLPSLASANNFNCTIANVSNVDGSGNIVPDTSFMSLGKTGDQFSVNEKSGKIIGSKILANDDSGNPVVTKRGKGNSYIVLTQHKSGDVSVLKIFKYKKPMQFIYLSTITGQASGVCVHY